MYHVWTETGENFSPLNGSPDFRTWIRLPLSSRCCWRWRAWRWWWTGSGCHPDHRQEMCGSAPCCWSSPSPACCSVGGRTHLSAPLTASTHNESSEQKPAACYESQVTNLECEGVNLLPDSDELWIVVVQTLPYPNISIIAACYNEPEEQSKTHFISFSRGFSSISC